MVPLEWEEFAYRTDPLVPEIGTAMRFATLIREGRYESPVEVLRRYKNNSQTGLPEAWVYMVDPKDHTQVSTLTTLAETWERVKLSRAGRTNFDEYLWHEMTLEKAPL